MVKVILVPYNKHGTAKNLIKPPKETLGYIVV